MMAMSLSPKIAFSQYHYEYYIQGHSAEAAAAVAMPIK